MLLGKDLIIGTLGNDSNDVTCSILAVKSLQGNFTIDAFSEFEYAAESLICNKIDAMVVPGAYPDISKFIMNDLLVVTDVFTYVIPPIVFVSQWKVFNKEYNVLYNHPATNSLLDDICSVNWYEQENVSSNTIACLKVLERGKDCCAITNAACAEKYGLEIHQVIRPAINMPFIIFKNIERKCKI